MKSRLISIVCGLSCWLFLATAFAEVVKAYEGQVTLPTYPWQPDIPHPYFPETDGRNIYPYPMQDDLRPDRAPRIYKTVVLESDLVKLTFIPELGGRIWEAIDKVTGKPIFYVNHVVKPGLIAMRGAWISGGVEFNTGPQGHTVTAISPVDVLILSSEDDGSRSVAVGDIDRIYRLQWTVVVTLRPGRRLIEEQVAIYNRTETVCPYYFWNCTAQPNTPGFRFVYPMTLSTDHAGTTFYRWPVNDGVDLSQGKNYRHMSSIFAYECDQDFFGSYDEDEDRGCVAFADHRQLPGKKAWTWGWGGDGIAHQRMLTDDDGPYNEVQTGPLRTQAETGRLDPHEAITWKEWWYPVHGLGGPFTFANRDICARAQILDGQLDLRVIGTGTWTDATIEVKSGGSPISRAGPKIESRGARIDPRRPMTLKVRVGEPPVFVEVSHGDARLASFSVPLSLPERQPPKPETAERSAAQIASEGWKMLLLGRRSEAVTEFQNALNKDAGCVEALLGLAHYKLIEALPTEAEPLAKRAIDANSYDGGAHFTLALALDRLGKEREALDSAWRAALDPATAVAARALIGKILVRQGNFAEAVEALSAAGPWADDPVCRGRLSIAFLQLGRLREARATALGTIQRSPLDTLARYVLARLKEPGSEKVLSELISRDPECSLELAFSLSELGMNNEALDVVEQGDVLHSPIAWYAMNYLRAREGLSPSSSNLKVIESVFPSRLEEVPILEHAVQSRPKDTTARLLLGDLCFSVRQYGKGREFWKESVAIDPSNPIPLRSLGMAAWKLDGDSVEAERYLRRALSVAPRDGIVARDLASVIQTQVRADSEPSEKKALLAKARDVLLGVLPHNMHRADLVEMVARLHNRLDEPEKTAALLDSIRVTSWEGAQGLHDEFRAAHLALGKRHFEAGRFAEAVSEFRRSLEYPENLGIGRRDGTREADLYYWFGMALSKVGKHDEARAAWKTAASEPSSGNAEIERCRKVAEEALNKQQ